MESNNPKCKHDEILDAFHDDELSAAERADVEMHLESCQVCVDKLAQIDKLVTTLRTEIPRLETPSGLSDKLDNLVSQQTKVVAWRTRGVQAAAAVAAVAFIVVGARSWIAQPGQTVANVDQTAKPVAIAKHVEAAQPPVVAKAGGEKLSAKQNAIANVDDSVLPAPAKVRVNPSAQNLASAPVVDRKEFDAKWAAVQATKQQKESAKPTLIASSKTQIAAKPAPATAQSPANEEIAELPTTTNSFTDAIGIATDEDGLYDIQM